MGIAFMMPFFMLYHIRNIYQNFTTNERYKSAQLQFGLKNQNAFLNAYLAKTKREYLLKDKS